MYHLYKIDEDTYQIHSAFYGEKAMEGTRLAIMFYCVDTLGFEPDELEIAISQMIHHNHNSASFGVNRTFIYTFPKKTKKVA